MIIRLKDETELNIENGATENCIAIVAEDLTVIDSYVKALTRENLEVAEIIDENNSVVSKINNKYLGGFDGVQVVESTEFIVCFRLADVYSIEDRLAMLEAENAELRASQEIQDEAIVELADIIAE